MVLPFDLLYSNCSLVCVNPFNFTVVLFLCLPHLLGGGDKFPSRIFVSTFKGQLKACRVIYIDLLLFSVIKFMSNILLLQPARDDIYILLQGIHREGNMGLYVHRNH